jgi:hypothetical protein
MKNKFFMMSLSMLTGALIYGETYSDVWSDLKDSVIPDKLSCAHWTAHPYYAQTVFAIKDNKDELNRQGVHDVNSCKDKRDVIVGLVLAKFGIALAGVSWDLGRCACEDAY